MGLIYLEMNSPKMIGLLKWTEGVLAWHQKTEIHLLLLAGNRPGESCTGENGLM